MRLRGLPYVCRAAAVLVVAAVFVAAAQDRFQDVEIRPEKVAGGVYCLYGQGGNIGVSVGPDGVLIIDTQFAPLAPKIRAALAGLKEGAPRFLVNTHHHGDHTGGNPEFGKAATVLAHQNVRRRLKAEQAESTALPVITFGESLQLHFNGDDIEVRHFPRAHTDGDAVVFFPQSNALHMGDLFFAGRFPYIDLDAGGSVQGMRDAIATVLEEFPDDVRLIPGHGEVCGREALEEYLDMLEDSIDFVQAGLEAGQGVREIQAEGMPPRYKGWGSGFIPEQRWIDIVYRSLKGA